eukprot:755656-Hanusia_phi.AAC.11
MSSGSKRPRDKQADEGQGGNQRRQKPKSSTESFTTKSDGNLLLLLWTVSCSDFNSDTDRVAALNRRGSEFLAMLPMTITRECSNGENWFKNMFPVGEERVDGIEMLRIDLACRKWFTLDDEKDERRIQNLQDLQDEELDGIEITQEISVGSNDSKIEEVSKIERFNAITTLFSNFNKASRNIHNLENQLKSSDNSIRQSRNSKTPNESTHANNDLASGVEDIKPEKLDDQVPEYILFSSKAL